MNEMKSSSILLKEHLEMTEYTHVNELQKQCIKFDNTSLKLELDYKLSSIKASGAVCMNEVNEFLYYIGDQLVGYIGIGSFGGSTLEVNGMVHPDYRRQGVFSKLFQLVKDEWVRRGDVKMQLLSDSNSTSGLGFIKSVGASYEFAEYEMYLKNEATFDTLESGVVFRKATNDDAKEIAAQNVIYFGDVHEESTNDSINDDDHAMIMPEEEEQRGMLIYIVEVDNEIIGKVHLESSNNSGAIYGLGVLPKHRRKGYGRQILIQSIKKLQENHCEEIKLQVVTENKKALDLYIECGFSEVSTMNYYQMNRLAEKGI